MNGSDASYTQEVWKWTCLTLHTSFYKLQCFFDMISIHPLLKTINSHELFSTFDAFLASLDDARAENQRRLAAAREAEKQIRITRERKERISTASKVRNLNIWNCWNIRLIFP